MSGSIHNPVDIEKKIEETKNRIAEGVSIVSNAEIKAKAARTTADKAFAQAYVASESPAHMRKYEALLATVELREAAEVAEVAFHHAERTAWAINHELGAWQSISKSVVAMYEAVRPR